MISPCTQKQERQVDYEEVQNSDFGYLLRPQASTFNQHSATTCEKIRDCPTGSFILRTGRWNK